MPRKFWDQQKRYGISRLRRDVGDIVSGHFRHDCINVSTQIW
jgi:hypothetical protein